MRIKTPHIRRHHIIALGAIVAIAGSGAVVHHSPQTPNSTQTCHAQGLLPDPTCTPGATDPRVTQANINQTICVSGYTSTVRPPVSVTAPEKIQSQKEYGYSSSVTGEYDHLIPLELGGSSDTKNLWFEVGSIPNPKDKIENLLHARVCAGTITLQEAQSEISTDWTQVK